MARSEKPVAAYLWNAPNKRTGILCSGCVTEEGRANLPGVRRATKASLQRQFIDTFRVSESNPAYCDNCSTPVVARAASPGWS
jgi:hypothetical protein